MLVVRCCHCGVEREVFFCGDERYDPAAEIPTLRVGGKYYYLCDKCTDTMNAFLNAWKINNCVGANRGGTTC